MIKTIKIARADDSEFYGEVNGTEYPIGCWHPSTDMDDVLKAQIVRQWKAAVLHACTHHRQRCIVISNSFSEISERLQSVAPMSIPLRAAACGTLCSEFIPAEWSDIELWWSISTDREAHRLLEKAESDPQHDVKLISFNEMDFGKLYIRCDLDGRPNKSNGQWNLLVRTMHPADTVLLIQDQEPIGIDCWNNWNGAGVSIALDPAQFNAEPSFRVKTNGTARIYGTIE